MASVFSSTRRIRLLGADRDLDLKRADHVAPVALASVDRPAGFADIRGPVGGRAASLPGRRHLNDTLRHRLRPARLQNDVGVAARGDPPQDDVEFLSAHDRLRQVDGEEAGKVRPGPRRNWHIAYAAHRLALDGMGIGRRQSVMAVEFGGELQYLPGINLRPIELGAASAKRARESGVFALNEEA